MNNHPEDLYSENVRVNERRRKVAALKLQGFSHREIAIRLGMEANGLSAATVSQDLQVVNKAWKQSTMRDFDLDKGRLLAELELLKRELWEEWNKSKRKRVQVKDQHPALVSVANIFDAAKALSEQELEELIAGTSQTAGTSVERTMVVEQREGNYQYAKGILEIIDRECELLGLHASNGEQSTSPPVIGFRIHVPEEKTA